MAETTETNNNSYPTPELLELTRRESGVAFHVLSMLPIAVGALEPIQNPIIKGACLTAACALTALGLYENFSNRKRSAWLGEMIWGIGSEQYPQENILKGLFYGRKAHFQAAIANLGGYIGWGVSEWANKLYSTNLAVTAGLVGLVTLVPLTLSTLNFKKSTQTGVEQEK